MSSDAESKKGDSKSTNSGDATNSSDPKANEKDYSSQTDAGGDQQNSSKWKSKVHIIQNLIALNYESFSNVTWKLLEKQWKEKYTLRSFRKGAEKLLLIVCANMLMIQHTYCTGAFSSLVPLFEEEFWDP